MSYDVVVIGAGAAGLVCASLLAHAGRKVALVEKHRRAGSERGCLVLRDAAHRASRLHANFTSYDPARHLGRVPDLLRRHERAGSRLGVDKAARSGITSAEAVLGRRLEHFADTVRY